MAVYTVFNVAVLVILGLIARFADKNKIEKEKGGYSTQNLVIVAVLAAIAGVINTGVGNIWYLANTSLGPLGGALIQGMFMWAYILAAFIVKKPGVALIFGLIESATEVLLGNAAGIGTLGWGISQGLGIEIVLLICAYSRFGMVTAIMAGVASSQFGTLWSSIFYGCGSGLLQRCLDRCSRKYDLRCHFQRSSGIRPGGKNLKDRTPPVLKEKIVYE